MFLTFINPEDYTIFQRRWGNVETCWKYHPTYKLVNIELLSFGSNHIADIYKDALDLARKYKCRVFFEANGILISARENSPEDLVEKYLDWCYDYGIKELGPEIPPTPTEKQIREREFKDWKREFDFSNIQKKRAEDKKLMREFFNEVHEEIKLKVPIEEYNSFKEKQATDGYSRTCVEFAEDLARLLQLRLEKGKLTKELVEKTSNEVDDYMGISGFMYGIVVEILRRYWEPFDEEWFN